MCDVVEKKLVLLGIGREYKLVESSKQTFFQKNIVDSTAARNILIYSLVNRSHSCRAT